MNLREFRKQTKDLSGDTEIFSHHGDFECVETEIEYVLPPATHSDPEDGKPLALYPALILSGGQPINLDYDLDARVDQGD